MLPILSILTAWAISAVAPDGRPPEQVLVSVRPRQIYIEKGETGQQLNFDFFITNRTDDNLIINRIELSVLDDAGKLVRREFYDEHSRKALELSPSRELKEGASILLYNPFHTFAADVPLKKLHYEFGLSTKDRKKQYSAAIDVAPIVYETKTNLILPVRGRVLVWDGHDYASHHRRTDVTTFPASFGYETNFQRYSYDFILVDEQGLNYRGRPRSYDDWYEGRPDRLQDYYSFGAPIYAAGAGRVVLVRDTRPDDRQVDMTDAKTNEFALGGNYIVIDHLNGEFSWFGHIKQGSARVKVGQVVQQGEVIAAMGASGSSLFPHLHYELRDALSQKKAEGLPSYFSNFSRIYGSRSVSVKRGAINTGDLVEAQGSEKK